MEREEYIDAIHKYKKETINNFRLICALPIPHFNSTIINCNNLHDQKTNIIKLVKELGIKDKIPFLYYFKIISDYDKQDLIHKISSYKDRVPKGQPNYLALPLIKGHIDSNILYVGKSQGDFFTRFKVHMGYVGDGTYGLHIKRWFELIGVNPNLILEMSYSTLALSSNQLHLLEVIESSLHLKLNPILGRSGH